MKSGLLNVSSASLWIWWGRPWRDTRAVLDGVLWILGPVLRRPIETTTLIRHSVH
jgi:hypothetical protein